ncbi:MAG: acyl-CoA thioesterase [Vicinamibacterales bacterium]|nr:acyl-CoA thioesterase [Vicinamibacterales bacterium]
MSTYVCDAPVRVRYAETDQMGFAYYANYLAWFEVGRCEWLRSLGWSYRDLEARDAIMLPVIEAHCEYRQPARYDDELLIRSRGELASPVRIRFTYDVVRAGDGAVLASGHTVHASTDLAGRPKRLPARVRAFFAQAGRGAGDSAGPAGRVVE